MVVEHRLNVLEPLKLRSCLVIVKNACIQHQAGHHQSANGERHQLRLIGDAPGPPDMEETGGDLDALEAGTHVAVEDLLAEDRPYHLSAWLHMGGIGEPAGEIGEVGAMEKGTAQPDEDHGQVAEVSTKDLPRNLFKVTRVAVEIVSVGVEVPNPGGGFGTFREGSVEMSGLSEQFEGRWIVDLLDLSLRGAPTLWWADGHRVVPRGTGSRWWDTPPEIHGITGAPGADQQASPWPGASGVQSNEP